MSHSIVRGCILCMALSLTTATHGANKPKSAPTNDAVQELLLSETQAANAATNRRESLQPASLTDNERHSVGWQAGYLQAGKKWVPFEDSIADGSSAVKLDEYQSMRSRLSNQRNGHWQLAVWCRKNGLHDQERVHLLQVLEDKDPTTNLETVYERLGCQKYGNEWLSPQARREAVATQAALEDSYKHWHSKLEAIARQLEGSPKQVSVAQKHLAEIDSPSAVPMIVSVLCVDSPQAAEYGVKTLHQIRGFQASRALAGQAVFSPWRHVRSKATELLKDRDIEEYAPDLLSVLSKPIRTTIQSDQRNIAALPQMTPTVSTTGLNVDYVWADETQDHVQVGFRRLLPFWLPPGSYQVVSVRKPWLAGFYDASGHRLPVDPDAIAAAMIDQKESLDRAAETINDARSTVNGRVGKVLSNSTDQPMSDDPQIWWNWWTTYSNVAPLAQKSVVVVEERQPLQLVPTIRRSCLVAGTPVWTERGSVAIEQIRAGDRVLSKEIASGELAYKPVLRTTERAPTELQQFQIGDEEITASLGHHFWVSGSGWTKMRELTSQQPLHTVTGMLRISAVNNLDRQERVYNLVVADFHTYFVGRSMVLSHDVTTPALTNVKVPGLAVK